MDASLTLERPTLFVEGEDDAHAIIHLLAKHGIELDRDTGPVYVNAVGSDKNLIITISLAAKAAAASTVGFVIDIDGHVEDRWKSVRNKLKQFSGAALPDLAPAAGLVTEAEGARRIGAWLMPDNKTDGACLENLLDQLIPANSDLRAFAESATDEAQQRHGALHPAKYRLKAILRTWLAWQAEPGIAYGNAIKAGWLTAEHKQVTNFVEWFKELYKSHLGS